jgi:quercetin dioxygenase-like cupin family protein
MLVDLTIERYAGRAPIRRDVSRAREPWSSPIIPSWSYVLDHRAATYWQIPSDQWRNVMNSAPSRRQFNRGSFISLLTTAAAMSVGGLARAQQPTASGASTRRDVIKRELPGEPLRVLSLVEVKYPPGVGSPPHLHANGVMAYVVSGVIASKVGDEPEQVFHAGDAWWEPPGAVHRVSRNASLAEPAILLAIYIAPKGATATDLMKPL